jgi:transcriptional regulator with XRE-family HTH domain
MGVSQTKLAESIGVTFQQIQKYERGANRVSFSALVRIAKALDCRVADLIEDVDGVAKAATACTPASVLLMQFGAADLLESYSKIQSKTVRQAIVDLSRKLSMSS